MPELPTGVVTLLFTDVEGSTRLWERDPDVMRAALARHDAILAETIRRFGGIVVKSRGEGDSFFAIFARASNAVAAAIAAQRLLQQQVWRTELPLRVRMALHTGKVELRESDYYGPTVNRCARLRSLAHGGQVLLSGVTAQLVANALPPGAYLKDLGTHRLKDLSAPERVCAVVHPDLPSDFPPLRSADVVALAGGASGFGPAPPVPTERLGGDDPGARFPRLYVVTDEHSRSADGREWAEGVTLHATGRGAYGGEGWIACYASPKVAALLNPGQERFRYPRLWEIAASGLAEPEGVHLACIEATAVRQCPLPRLSSEDRARCAVLAARSAYRSGLFADEYAEWSRAWLAGQDRAADPARRIAGLAESDAYRGGRLANLGALAASKAAEAAVHAARSAWLRGRAADEEAELAARTVAEAIHLATRLARLDLAALADQAVLAPEEAEGPPQLAASRGHVA